MNTEGFKHISVSRPDDDDIVIHAGVQEAAGDQSLRETPLDPLAPNEEDLAAGSEEPGSTEDGAKGPEGDRVRRGPSSLDGEERLRITGAQPNRDGFQPTTLEDLEQDPMSLTQKVVIIAAVVCIIGAIAYYFLFLR